jgi:hypothetical protein
MTTWSPDTCSCVLTLNPDGETGVAVTSCKLHNDPDPAQAFQKTLGHNRNKNAALAAAAAAGIDADWKINSDGSLALTLSKSSPALEQKLKSSFGASVAISAAVAKPSQ